MPRPIDPIRQPTPFLITTYYSYENRLLTRAGPFVDIALKQKRMKTRNIQSARGAPDTKSVTSRAACRMGRPQGARVNPCASGGIARLQPGVAQQLLVLGSKHSSC